MSPRCDLWIQSWKLLSAVRPRVIVTSPVFGRPGSFLLTYLPSLVLCFSSMTSCSILRPLTSCICLTATPSNSRPNDQPTLVSISGRPTLYSSLDSLVSGRLLGQGGPARELGQLEDDELRWLDWSHTDLADDHPGIDGLRRVGLVVTLDEEGLVRRQTEQGALAPLVDEERRDGPPHLGPQRVVV